MYNSLRPVSGLCGTQLYKLLELRAAKKMSLITTSVTPPIEGLIDDEISELIALRKGLGIRSPAHNDSVPYIRTGRCLNQPAATATFSSQNPTIYAILQK